MTAVWWGSYTPCPFLATSLHHGTWLTNEYHVKGQRSRFRTTLHTTLHYTPNRVWYDSLEGYANVNGGVLLYHPIGGVNNPLVVYRPRLYTIHGWLGGLLVERRTSVSQIRGSIPRQVAAV